MDVKSLPKVLYIEDTDHARALVRRVLDGLYIVLEASDPLSGIELARDTLPDLVLLDINLPNMTGNEVATRLKSIVPNAPLVAVTADTSPGARERALAAGFAGFMSKPIDVDTFAIELDEFFHGKREMLDNAETHLRAYQVELVEHLETKIRELTHTLNRNRHLQRQNEEMINILIRRQAMLEAGARV
ncbi:MAG: response regulator, partial [Chloroflexi bacterium]